MNDRPEEKAEPAQSESTSTPPAKAASVKPSPLVQELCKKLKFQLEELTLDWIEPSCEESEESRKNLFQELKDQLAKLT